MALRVAFFGTPAFAVPTLDAIANSAHSVAGVITQPDRPRGRGHRVTPGEVSRAAAARGFPILQPDRLKSTEFLEAFDALGADVGVVAAYGKLLPQVLLDRPRLGFINVHASLLPRWRGAAPVHRAILAGDVQSGVTIMRVVLALDAGPMMAKRVVTVGPDERSTTLESRLAIEGAAACLNVLDDLEAGRATEVPQDERLVTYAARLERQDGHVDWNQPATTIHNQVRGLHPWPLATVMIGGVRVRLVACSLPDGAAIAPDGAPGAVVSIERDGFIVGTGQGRLKVVHVQPEGRAAMSARDFANGYRLVPGTRLEPVAMT